MEDQARTALIDRLMEVMPTKVVIRGKIRLHHTPHGEIPILSILCLCLSAQSHQTEFHMVRLETPNQVPELMPRTLEALRAISSYISVSPTVEEFATREEIPLFLRGVTASWESDSPFWGEPHAEVLLDAHGKPLHRYGLPFAAMLGRLKQALLHAEFHEGLKVGLHRNRLQGLIRYLGIE